MVVVIDGSAVLFAIRGQTPDVAELNFLLTATQLDTYGVDPHPVKVITQQSICVIEVELCTRTDEQSVGK